MKRFRISKRIWIKAFGTFAALLCMFVFLPSARADEARILITANPTELVDGGNVTFNFEINNYNADYPMTDVLISYNGTDYNVLDGLEIAPSSQMKNISLVLSVSASQLGKPIVFTVKWTRNGEPMSQDESITIQQAENPIISVTRTASKTNVKPGEQVVLTYTIKNTTKFDMTDITLIDENISDKPIYQNETLRASRTMSYDYTYTMGDESVTSTPLVTYTVNEKAKTFSSIDPLELTMVLVKLNLSVQEGTPTSSGVNFTLVVTNTGTQAINDITINDERENPVNEAPFSLEAGDSNTLSYLIVPLMTEPLRNVKFTLAGTDPFGEAYTLAPDDIYEVYPFVDSSQISVTIRAETVTPWTTESNKLTARIIITNHSSVELTDVSVYETTIGVINHFDLLPAGETTFDQEVTLGSPRNLSLTVKGYDPTGTNRELANCVMPVAYGTQTAAPATVTPAPSGGSMTIFSGISNGIAKILIVLGVLMVFSFIILIVLTAIERSRSPRRRDEEEEEYANNFFQNSEVPHRGYADYQDTPDPEEISYTKKMLAMKDEGQFGTVNSAPMRLPPPSQQRPADQTGTAAQRPPRVSEHVREQNPRQQVYESEPVREQQPPRPAPRVSEPIREQRPQTKADQVADRLVQTARSRYTEEQSSASYRPAGGEAKPYTPHPKQMAQAAAPRVFDYRKQPKKQAVQKSPVTRVKQNRKNYPDDEEQ